MASHPGCLDFDIPKLEVKRSYLIPAGRLTRGDIANYRIGFEGSTLASNTIVELSTEWTTGKWKTQLQAQTALGCPVRLSEAEICLLFA